MTNFATLWLRQNPGSDVAVFQAMAHTIVKEELYDPDFIAERTEGFNEYLESLESFTPEWAEEVTGVPAESIREAARLYANAGRAAIYWGMGISQSTHGTDNTLSLVNLALMCGHVGKAGTGLNHCAARITSRAAPTAAACPTSTLPTSAWTTPTCATCSRLPGACRSARPLA